jgi:hypothetical protein
MSDAGATGFVWLETSHTSLFHGKNNQSLRLRGEDGSGSHGLFEEKGARGCSPGTMVRTSAA